MKRIILLTAAVVVLTASLPAAAQAQGPWFTVNGVKIGAGKVPVDFTWKQAFTRQKDGLKIGPCPASGKEKIWNGMTRGEDEVTAITYTVPCNTSVANCTATKITPKKLPWPTYLALVGGAIKDEVEFFEVEITFDNGAACKGAGLGGKTISITGGVKGMPAPAGTCLEFENAEGLFWGEDKVLLSGEQCREGEEGEVISTEE